MTDMSSENKSKNGRELTDGEVKEARLIAGWLAPQSDLSVLLERPHAEYTAATGRDDYLCEHCEGEMQVREIEFEGVVEKFQSGTKGDKPVMSHKLGLIIYVTHSCGSPNCLSLELSYDM